MTTAAAYTRRSSTKTVNAIAGVDLSSWVSWACYGLGFAVALHVVPAMSDDLLNGSLGTTLLAGAVAAFFGMVLFIQNEMRVSLRNTSFGEPEKLVTAGVFAISRNPMYVAFLLPLLSIAYYSPLAAAGAAILYVVAMNALVISVEEDTLSANFGGRFGQYCLNTPRWLVW